MGWGKAIHRIFYAGAALCLGVSAFGMRQLVLISVLLLFIGAGFHVRWHRGIDATSAHPGSKSIDPRMMSRPGLHDRYEGIVTSLTRRRE